MIAHELNMMGVAEGELSTIQDTCSILLNISGSVPPLGVILSFYRSLMGIRSPVSPLGPVQKFEEWIVHRIQTIPWHDKVSDLFRDPKKRAMRLALFTDLVLSRMRYERHLSFLDVKDFIALKSLPEGEGDTEDLCREYETLVSLGPAPTTDALVVYPRELRPPTHDGRVAPLRGKGPQQAADDLVVALAHSMLPCRASRATRAEARFSSRARSPSS